MLTAKGVKTMDNRRLVIYLTILATILPLAASFTAGAASVPRMATDELKSRLGDTDLVVLDVRANRDWSKSQEKIAGAERVSPSEVNQWAKNYPKEKTIILYCA